MIIKNLKKVVCDMSNFKEQIYANLKNAKETIDNNPCLIQSAKDAATSIETLGSILEDVKKELLRFSEAGCTWIQIDQRCVNFAFSSDRFLRVSASQSNESKVAFGILKDARISIPDQTCRYLNLWRGDHDEIYDKIFNHIYEELKSEGLDVTTTIGSEVSRAFGRQILIRF